MSLFRRKDPEETKPSRELPSGLSIVGVHRLEYEDSEVDAELDAMRIADPEEREALFDQFSENYRNAWLVVVEFSGGPEAIDFSRFSYGATPESPNNQAAWAETILASDAGQTKAAFYLHYLEPKQALWYGRARVSLPGPTPTSTDLFRKATYSSPD